MRGKLMHKAIVVLFAATALAGCSGGGDDPDEESSRSTTTTTASESETSTTTGQPATTTTTAVTPATTEPPQSTTTTPPAGNDDGDYGDPCNNMDGWDTRGEHDPTTSGDDRVFDVSAGRHDGCDRLVFWMTGLDPVGYTMDYGSFVNEDTQAAAEVEGPVDLTLTINAWPAGYDSNHPFTAAYDTEVYPADGRDKGLFNVTVVQAMGAYEGYTTFVIGLREENVLRLFTTLSRDDDNVLRRVVIIEVAH